MRCFLRFVCVLALVVSSNHAFADVRVVAPSGAPFTTIQAAVNAANDGDVILVRTGTYTGFTITNKALDVVGDVNASVIVTTQTRVQGLAATREVSLTNLRVSAALGHAIVLDANTGAVRLQDCFATGGSSNGVCDNDTAGGSGVNVTSSANVSLVRCVTRGGAALGGCLGPTGGAGVWAQNSSVALFDTSATGDRGGLACWQSCNACGYTGYTGYGGIGGPGALVWSTTMFVEGSTLTGGAGGGNCHSTFDGGWGGPGLWLFNAANVASVSSTFTGGPPASSGWPMIPGVPIQGTGAQLSTIPAHHLTATATAREGQLVSLSARGNAGETVELVWARRARWLLMPSFQGVLLVRLDKPPMVQQLGTIGANGTLQTSWTVPDLGAGVQSSRWFLQPVFTAPNGTVSYGPPATVVLLDAAF